VGCSIDRLKAYPGPDLAQSRPKSRTKVAESRGRSQKVAEGRRTKKMDIILVKVLRSLGVVSKYSSRVNHTSDFQNRPPPGGGGRPAPNEGLFLHYNAAPWAPGEVGVGAWQKSRRCGCLLKCVLTPPLSNNFDKVALRRKAKSRKVAEGRTKSRNVACNPGDLRVQDRLE
jgi:hypothetical protein